MPSASLRTRSLATRWLGVGLASAVAVVTLGLAATDRLALYINPDSSWFAVSMAVVVLVGAVLSFLLPLGAETDHGHDHGDAPARRRADHGRDPHAHRSPEPTTSPEQVFRPGQDVRGQYPPVSTRTPVLSNGSEGAGREGDGSEGAGVEGAGVEGAGSEGAGVAEPEHRRSAAAATATAVGGVVASGIVVLTLVLPPASLSAELAMSRDVGATPLFAGADVVALASTGDTSQFGIGEWATVFATATNPEAFDGTPVTLTGFVTPGDADFQLSRLVITHCVIDAQPASIPVVSTAAPAPETGQWVTVTGTVRSSSDGRLVVDAASVEFIDEPQDPYEY